MFRKLCPPAYIYLIISIMFILYSGIKNIFFHTKDDNCLGGLSCNIGSPIFMFIFNILYVVLWTYILNLLCSTGKFGTGVSWFLILLPFLVLTLAMYMISNNFIDQIMKQ